MARRWSKLQKQIYNLVDAKVPLQMHCIDVRTQVDAKSLRSLGLYQIRLGKQIIWNFPQDFITRNVVYPDGGDCFSYSATDINELVREYIDTPKDELLEKQFDMDWFGLTDILKAADRRFGRAALSSYFKGCENQNIIKILAFRFGE